MENRKYETRFSEKSRKLDGRKNIDDVWWVTGMSDRRREIENIEQEINKASEMIEATDERIEDIDEKINAKQNGVNLINTGLQIGTVLAGAAFLISILGAGISQGFEIWCGLMLVPGVVGVSAIMVKNEFKKEIEAFEEDRCIEEIDRSSYQRTIESLTYKRNVMLGEKSKNIKLAGNDILDRPQCIYYHHTPIGDENNYSDEVFQVGGTEPYNWTAHKLINRIHSVQEERAKEKVKSR